MNLRLILRIVKRLGYGRSLKAKLVSDLRKALEKVRF